MSFKIKNNKNIDSSAAQNNVMELTTANLKLILSNSSDVRFRQISITDNNRISITLAYIDGLVNPSYVSEYILKPLFQESKFNQANNADEVIRIIDKGNIYFSSQYKTNDINSVLKQILSGSSVLIFDENNTAIIFDTKGFEKRAITEPSTENITKGSKDTFVETLYTNVSIIRQKIKSQNLVIEEKTIGKQTNTSIGLVYINGLTNTDLVDEVKKRLDNINVDNVLTSGFIEEFLCDNINSTFPQLLNTERADKFCAEIIEGRVGIIIDGIPFLFIAPGTFVQFMQSPIDYTHSYIIKSALRLMRYILFVVSLVLPAFFISITTFHLEMIPTELALAIAKSREGVTFPVFMETILMLIAFETLIEASLRIPKAIGQSISIVGTLIVGEAAIQAKLVSPTVVIVIAVTAISSFAMPNLDISNALRNWRLFFTILSSIVGLFGLVIGIIILVHHLCKLESFGVPYLVPLVSASGENQIEDTFFRFPLNNNKMRSKNHYLSNKKAR